MPVKKEIMNNLKEEILSLKLTPGTLISETALSERYHISRTPIRDILKQLSMEDYIHIYPKKGNIVSFIDLESVEQIIFLRYTLEKEILKDLSGHLPLKGLHDLKNNLIMQKECIDQEEGFEQFLQLDDALHKKFFEMAGRLFLWNVIQQCNVHYIRYRKLHMLKKEKLIEILSEHEQLVNLMVRREPEQIDQLLQHHLRSDISSIYFQEHFKDYIKK